MTITGEKIFDQAGITVHQCVDGYTISNGTDVIVLSFLPLLDEQSLSAMFKTNCGYEVFQLGKYGNVIKETKCVKDDEERINAFDIWFNKESELLEMHSMGY